LNIAVCVKSAIDESELKADATGKPQLQGAQMKMSTFDRNAVEEAVRIKESKGGSTVTVVSLGAMEGMKKSIREALAMGCDKAAAIVSGPDLDTLATAYYLARAVQRLGGVELVICSEGASDTYDGLIGAMVAEWLGLPFMGYVRKATFDGAGTLTCELAGEQDVAVYEAKLPAVIAVVSEINSPRYPTLLQIMQASKKPIEELSLETLKDERAPGVQVKVVDVSAQTVSRKKIIFEGAPDQTARQLVDALRKEGVLK
jgi:electron transfer flavoprotein beta subunit